MEDTLTAFFNELTIKHGILLTPEPQLELGCGHARLSTSLRTVSTPWARS
jgi:hypothetical protein